MLEEMTGAEAERRRRAITAEIAKVGFCLPGSLVLQTRRCSTPGCHCHTDPACRHGPYRLWTRKVAGKTVTRALTREQFDKYTAWVDNSRQMRQLLAELEQLSVEAMAADEEWPAPAAPPPDRRRSRHTEAV